MSADRVSTQEGVEMGWSYKIRLAHFRWKVTAGKKGGSMTAKRWQAAGDRIWPLWRLRNRARRRRP